MLTIEEGKDYIIEDRQQLPYQILGNLGHGHSGNVEKIKDTNTGAIYACKTIRIYGARLRDSRRKIFENEIKIIRSLTGHRHVVRVFATYVSNREVGLILQPVADEGDLEDFLGKYSDLTHEKGLAGSIDSDSKCKRMTSVLERAFGCLLSGLAFMHQQKIRHKDIKPRNILIHQGNVVYTDFGYSLDSSQLGYSTTSGKPEFMTRRYSAPEVVDHDLRNSLSDVFSLGCVFLDLLGAMTSFDIYPERCFFEVMNDIFKQLRATTSTIPPRLLFLVDLIFLMTAQDPSHRSTAVQASNMILQHPGFCCEDCRLAFNKAFFGLETKIDKMTLQEPHTAPKESQGGRKTESENTEAFSTSTASMDDHFDSSSQYEKAKHIPEDTLFKPLRFKDAVGRKFSFPWSICKTWKGMEELINSAFLHVDIVGPHVKEGHYDLIGPDEQIILPSVWESVVQPDWAVTMIMWPAPASPPPPPPPPPFPLPPPPPSRSSRPRNVEVRRSKKRDKAAPPVFPPIPPPPIPTGSPLPSGVIVVDIPRPVVTSTPSRSKKVAPSPFMKWAAGSSIRSQTSKKTKKT